MTATMDMDVGKLADRVLNGIVDSGGEAKGLRLAKGGNAFSWYESDAGALEESLAKALMGRAVNRQMLGRQLPKGYERSEFETFGHFIKSGLGSEQDFRKSYDPALTSLKKSLADTHTTLDFESAGVLVLPEFAPNITAMLYESEGLWSRVRKFTVSGNRMTFPKLKDTNRADGTRHGGVLGYWTGEGDLIQSTKAKFDATEIKLDKLAVAIYITEELKQDNAYALQQFLFDVVTAELAYQTDRAIIAGDGIAKIQGILTSPHRVTVTKEGSQAAATINSQNILKMWSRRLSRIGDAGWVWLVNPDTEVALAQMSLATGSSSGTLTYMGPGGLSDRPYATLLGAPVLPCEHCKPLGTEGDIILWNPGLFYGVSKGAVNQAVSSHVEFLRDIDVVKFTWRLGGRPLYDTPFQLENSTNARSSIVTLQTRA